jgi:hypothetical protein
MNERLLQLELRLLVLRHGRRAVLDALATSESQSVEELESEISALEGRKTARKPKVVTTESVIAKAFAHRPEAIPVVETLVRKYENKTFLPHLREVQRFIDRVGGPRGRLKSRSTALNHVIKALAKMSSEELSQVTDGAETHGESDYEILAREIMGPTAEGSSSDRRTARTSWKWRPAN